MNRIYLMPLIGTGTSRTDPRRPKHRDTILAVSGASYRMMDYGREPVCLVYALGIDAATHTTIAADAEVSALPEDLTQQVGAGALAAVQAALESRQIPGSNLIQASHTYRQVVRGVIILFQFAQRLDGLGFRLFGSGVTLATTYSALPAAVKTALTDMATSFGFSSAGITGSSTMRQIFKSMYDQWPATSVFLGEAF